MFSFELTSFYHMSNNKLKYCPLDSNHQSYLQSWNGNGIYGSILSSISRFLSISLDRRSWKKWVDSRRKLLSHSERKRHLKSCFAPKLRMCRLQRTSGTSCRMAHLFYLFFFKFYFHLEHVLLQFFFRKAKYKETK